MKLTVAIFVCSMIFCRDHRLEVALMWATGMIGLWAGWKAGRGEHRPRKQAGD